MKSLKILQLLAKIGKIPSRVIFICCLVGVCGCTVGIIALCLGTGALEINGLRMEAILQSSANLSSGTLYATMSVGLILCAGEAVLARFALHYFRSELADGTPFTLSGARALLRLGILTAAIPLGSVLLAELTQNLLAEFLHDVTPLRLDDASSVWLGLALIVMSLLCRYGADLRSAPAAPESCAQQKLGA